MILDLEAPCGDVYRFGMSSSCRVAIISSLSLIECGIICVSFIKFAFLVTITSIMDLEN